MQWRLIAALLTVVATATGAPPAVADDGGRFAGGDRDGRATDVYTFAENAGVADGNPEGVAFDRRTGAFYVSRVATGAIYRGVLGDPGKGVQAFIPGRDPGDGALAAGLKLHEGRLYVAGATTGLISVYDAATGAPHATFDTKTLPNACAATFVNDLVVTRDGDVYATDSFCPRVYRVSRRAVARATGTVEAIDVAPEIPYVSNPDRTPGFNLNGIVAEDDDALIVVQSATGRLFRIGVDGDSAEREIDEIRVEGGPLTGGDGLLLDRGRLLVVQGSVAGHDGRFADGAVTVVKLRGRRSRAEVETRFGDPSLAGPSTIVRARDRYLVVNARFGHPAPYTVSALPRGGLGDD
jgi:Cu-Zn family superoxide dismutase